MGKERKEKAVVADIRDQDGYGGKNEGRRFRSGSLVRRRLWPSSLVPIRVFCVEEAENGVMQNNQASSDCEKTWKGRTAIAEI